MLKIWSNERPWIISALLAIALAGLIFGHWWIAATVVLSGYIIWLYYRLHRLQKWVARGTKASEVYEDEGFIGTIIRPLYHQKKTYNKRKKRTKDILRRLHRNISALPDATVLMNDQLEIEWSNEPAKYLLGIDHRKDLGQRIGNLIRHPNFLRYLITPDSKKNIEIHSPMDSKISLHVKIVRFGRNQRLLTARNNSDQKQLQEGLKNFVANASHELKTPLTVISGYLEMLENDPEISEMGRKSVQAAYGQAERMKNLIRDLLLLSKVESYQLQTDEGDEVVIQEIMSNTMTAVNQTCNSGNIVCEIPQDLSILGIKSEIEGICINLVQNAIKYAGLEKPIKIKWKKNKEGEAVFSVKDQGPGIAADEIPLITERYYRGKQLTSGEPVMGSGLGLAIVKQASSKHGATLDIQSTVDKGSSFTVTFPSYRVIKSTQPSRRNVVDIRAAG